MNISIIRAELDHLDQVVPLFDAYRQFYEQAADPTGARRFLRERLERQESVIFLALVSQPEVTEIGVGFTQLYPSFTSTGMKPIWILNDLFVRPDYRRHGIARRLMEAASHLAMSTGAARLSLRTAKTNATAKALYAAMGYKLEEISDSYDLTL